MTFPRWPASSDMGVERLRRRFRSWGRRQLYSLFSSLGTLIGHRLGTLMTVLVLGIAMALPLGLYVAMKNLHGLDLRQEEWGAITVFLDIETTEAEALDLARVIEERADTSVVAISPEQGMQEFREASGFGEALDFFDDNPLPWVLLVTPQPGHHNAIGDAVGQLASWLGAREAVDFVQVDYKWLQRLAGLLALGDALIGVLSVMFSLAVVVVVGNTIRLDVASRSEEIQVLSLVGAGDGFIRQPFLYSGFWYGLLGALLALALLAIGILYLKYPLENLLDAYGKSLELTGLGGVQAIGALLAGGLLGLFGAWVSVERYLRQLRRLGRLGRS